MKRKLALFMVLAMIVSLIPMNVFAGSDNYVNSVKTVKKDEQATAVITFETVGAADFATGDSFKLTLHNADVKNVTGLTAGEVDLDVVTTSDNTIVLEFLQNSTDKEDTAQISLLYEVTATGNVTVDIDGLGSGISDQNGLVIGRGADGGSKVSISSVDTIGEGTQTLADITIEETAAGTFADGDIVKLKLPTDFTWVKPATAGSVDGYSGLDGVATVDSLDSRTLLVEVTDEDNGSKGGLILSGFEIDVDSDAKVGDVKLSVSNKIGDFTSETLVVAKYSDFGVTVELDDEDIPTIYTGVLDTTNPDQEEVKLMQINIEEDVTGSLLENRNFKVAFPSDVKIVAYEVTGDAGVLDETGDDNYINEDANDIEFSVANASSGTDTNKIELTFYVSVAPSFTGDITATLTGKALPKEYKVVAGKAVKRAEFTVEPVDVRLGLQNQSMGKIVITEPAAGEWAVGDDVVVVMPDGFEVNEDPKFEVTKGDMEIKDEGTDSDGNIVFTVDSDSSDAPAEITLTGGTIDLERNLAEGDYKIGVGGDILENGADADGQFDTSTFGKKVAFHVITPAPGDTKAGEKVVFTIGNAEYMVGATKMTADAAPYINEQGRTMLPLRALANALGVTDSNIMWNEMERSVTIFKGDATLKVVIGQMSFVKNGVAVPMDTQAVIVNSRTMLPLRAIGQALGAVVTWDEATRTVTVN